MGRKINHNLSPKKKKLVQILLNWQNAHEFKYLFLYFNFWVSRKPEKPGKGKNHFKKIEVL